MIKPVSDAQESGAVQQQPSAEPVAQELQKLSKLELLKAKVQAQQQEVKEKHKEQVQQAQAHSEKASVTEKEEVRVQNKFTEAPTTHAGAAAEAHATQKAERVMPPAEVLQRVATDPDAPPSIPGPPVNVKVPTPEQSFKLGARLMGDVRDAQGNKLTAAQVSQSIQRQQVPRTHGGYLTPATRPVLQSAARPTTPAGPERPASGQQTAPQAGTGTRPTTGTGTSAGTSGLPPNKGGAAVNIANPAAAPTRASSTGLPSPTVTTFSSPLLAEGTQRLNFDYNGFTNFTNFNSIVTFITITLVEIELEYKLKRKKLTHEWEKVSNLATKIDINKDAFDRQMERAMAVLDFCMQVIGTFRGSDKDEQDIHKENLSDANQARERFLKDVQTLPPALVFMAGVQRLKNSITGSRNPRPQPAPNSNQSMADRFRSMKESELGTMAAVYHDDVVKGRMDHTNNINTLGQNMRETLMAFNNKSIDSSAVNRIKSESEETRYSAAQNALISLLMSQRSQLAQRQYRA